MPLNIVHVGEIVKVFPKAKFILALRHPCDCVLSCFMQNFKLNDSMANFLSIEDDAILSPKELQSFLMWLRGAEVVHFHFSRTLNYEIFSRIRSR